MRHTRWMLAVVAAGLVALPASAQEAKTIMTQRGKVLFNDDLATGFAKTWKQAKGKVEVADGAVRFSELKDDAHAAVARVPVASGNVVIQYSFKLEGAKATSLSINSTKGHLSRAVITPEGLTVQKDSSDKNVNDKKEVLQSVKTPISANEWHTIVIELQGKEIVANIDGKVVAYGKHDGLDQAKSNFGLTVAGQSVSFKNFSVHEAQPNPSWETTRQKLIEGRK